MSKKIMVFENPFFHKGINVTVRRDRNWFSLLKKDETFEMSDIDMHNIGYGIVVEKACLYYKDIPEEIIALEHNPEGRTKQSLLCLLKKIYKDFSYDELVTVIQFKYLGPNNEKTTNE